MSRTIAEWNKYLEDLKRLRDKIYQGTKTTDGLAVSLSMEDCDIIWNLLNNEASKVFSTPLEFYRPITIAQDREDIINQLRNEQEKIIAQYKKQTRINGGILEYPH